MKSIEQIFKEEYRNPPELRIAKRLIHDGITIDDLHLVIIPSGLKNAVINCMRDLEAGREYHSCNNCDLWIYSK